MQPEKALDRSWERKSITSSCCDRVWNISRGCECEWHHVTALTQLESVKNSYPGVQGGHLCATLSNLLLLVLKLSLESFFIHGRNASERLECPPGCGRLIQIYILSTGTFIRWYIGCEGGSYINTIFAKIYFEHGGLKSCALPSYCRVCADTTVSCLPIKPHTLTTGKKWFVRLHSFEEATAGCLHRLFNGKVYPFLADLFVFAAPILLGTKLDS